MVTWGGNITARGVELSSRFGAKLAEWRALYGELVDLAGEMSIEVPHVVELLVSAHRVSRPTAKRMVRHAAAVTAVVTPTGHVRPAPVPGLREVMAAGVVDPEHVEVIVATVDQLPVDVPDRVRDLAVATLVEHATLTDALALRRVGRTLLDRIDQDGPEPRIAAEVGNVFRYHRTRDGVVLFSGQLEKVPAEHLEAMLTEHAKPVRQADGTTDPRTASERRGDAFAAIVGLAADRRSDPEHKAATVIVTMDFERLKAGVQGATLESGAPIRAGEVRRLACDAGIIPMVLGTRSVPVDRGKATRLAPPALRQALIVRDRGCTSPYCDRPARMTEVHHLKHWIDGGTTDLNNTALVCTRHHHYLHDTGWQIIMNSDGHPEFIAPAWLDLTQTPRRNVLWTA